MALQQSDIDDYIGYIRGELSVYGDKLAKAHQHGNRPSFDKEVKFMLLQSFVEIAEWYLDEWDDTTNNAFTVAEFNDIQQHINKIANSFHWLDLS